MKHLLVTLTLLLVLCVPVLAQNGFGPQGNHRHHRFGRHQGAANANTANRFQNNGAPGALAQGFSRNARGNNIQGAQAQDFNRRAQGFGVPGAQSFKGFSRNVPGNNIPNAQAQGFTRTAKGGKSAHFRHHRHAASAPGAAGFRRNN